jgi:predicted alpha/beta-fold hydrolase
MELFIASAYATVYLGRCKRPIIYAMSPEIASDLEGQQELFQEHTNAVCQAGRVFKTSKGVDKALDRWMDVPATRAECVVDKLVDIIKCVPSLHQMFWPSIYWFGNLQLVPFMATTIICKLLKIQRHHWAREEAFFEDGEKVRIAWAGSKNVPEHSKEHKKIIVIHHGAGGREDNIPGTHYTGVALERGWMVCAFVRRGHAGRLTRPTFNFFGSTDESRFLLENYVKKRFPNSDVYVVGMSAGSGMVARYMGEQGVMLKKAYEKAAKAGTLNGRDYQDFADEVPGYVCGAFGVAAGYNIEACMGRFTWPYNSILLATQNLLYLRKNRDLVYKHNPDHFEKLMKATNLQEWLDESYVFAQQGNANKDAYYDHCNPMRVAHHVVDPSLFIQARDDPVCDINNLYENLDLFQKPSGLAVAEVVSGSHCPFMPLRLNPVSNAAWTDQVMVEFFSAVMADRERRKGGSRDKLK